MARILENDFGRRNIKVSTDDIISIVREYQRLVGVGKNYDEIRNILDENNIFLVEDLWLEEAKPLASPLTNTKGETHSVSPFVNL